MQVVDHRPVGRVGLALAGGGPEGAIYEIGALRALDEAIEGLDLNAMPITVGVSAGAFVGACLANGITTAQLVRSVLAEEPGEEPLTPELFLMPAVGELVRRGAEVPRRIVEALADYLSRKDPQGGLLSALTGQLGPALPVGLFNNTPLRAYLERVFAKEGRTNDFRELRHPLVVVAADLDSGEAVRFGEGEWAQVPIAQAVQASTALPGLYPPVVIGGRYYVDGVLLKTLHTSVALERGAGLVLCVNPLVPVNTADAVQRGAMRRGNLVDQGMPTVLSQTFRTLIHSRLDTGLAAYRERYRNADILLFEPRRDDYAMFFTNVFSFAARRRVCEHAYRSTLANLAARRDEITPVLARHRLRLREDVLGPPGRDLWESVGIPRTRARRPSRKKAIMPSTAATRDLRDALAALEDLLGDA